MRAKGRKKSQVLVLSLSVENKSGLSQCNNASWAERAQQQNPFCHFVIFVFFFLFFFIICSFFVAGKRQQKVAEKKRYSVEGGVHTLDQESKKINGKGRRREAAHCAAYTMHIPLARIRVFDNSKKRQHRGKGGTI